MRRAADIRDLLAQLDKHSADDLESQDLDFKEWITRSRDDAIAQVVEMAVCMANGGGGSVVFGVRGRVTGRTAAIPGVPPEVDTTRLLKAVYDSTDPKLTPVFEDVHVPEGSGRILVMHVFSGMPPYTDTQGRAKIRGGKQCQPLTGGLRARVMVETGDTDFSAGTVDEPLTACISPSALEILRALAKRENAPDDLLRRPETEFLSALELLRGGQLTRAGLYLAGNPEAIARHLPNCLWTHERMASETEYKNRADGRDALPIALTRLEERINADNPITTVERGFFRLEYHAYPAIALREALMNALCHLDFRLPGPVLVKQYRRMLEISNPGGFVGDINPANIHHHPRLSRNPVLVQALTRLRLINHSNLGIGRMFRAMLIEGKEPPRIADERSYVRVSFKRQETSAAFREFVAIEEEKGQILEVDHLFVLGYLMAHPELDTGTAAELGQRRESEMRDILDDMAGVLDYLERGGNGGRGVYWCSRRRSRRTSERSAGSVSASAGASTICRNSR